MPQALMHTDFQFPGQTGFYRGKVRDVYQVQDQLIMVASDRISAFDHILPKGIPFKGQVLNQTATYFLKATQDIVPNWLISVPDPNVAIGVHCDPIKIEMVIRGYLAGHAWRVYRAGGRQLCGVSLTEGLTEGDKLPQPIITPATKAEEGHDEDISREEIIAQQMVSEKDYEQLEQYTYALFERGTKMAAAQGLILVDTKYEFGKKEDKILLIDEVHTPDSSRYYYLDGYEERQMAGIQQQHLSKEFVREWLIANGFQGLEGQKMPQMPQAFIDQVAARYIELYETVTGQPFEKQDTSDIKDRIFNNVLNYLA
jgi:phosphoribosylaminoimidazole-succinocarboxamide synthase